MDSMRTVTILTILLCAATSAPAAQADVEPSCLEPVNGPDDYVPWIDRFINMGTVEKEFFQGGTAIKVYFPAFLPRVKAGHGSEHGTLPDPGVDPLHAGSWTMIFPLGCDVPVRLCNEDHFLDAQGFMACLA